MKRIILAAAVVLASVSATWADGPSEVVVVPVMAATEIQDATSSAGGDNWVGIFMTLLLFGTGLAS